MLNISEVKIHQYVQTKKLKSFEILKDSTAMRKRVRLFFLLSLGSLGFMFLPWTQNIKSNGYITSLLPEQKPQQINSIISGRIENWYVIEGDLVKKGDTILFVSETKDEYFDPKLLERTQQQINAKEESVKSYFQKITALDQQIDALLNSQTLKLQQNENKLKQAKLKVISDSADLIAARNNYLISETRLKRSEDLYKQGLTSLADLETRRLHFQEQTAKLASAENKYSIAINELLNIRIEVESIQADFRDKIAKTESEKASAVSMFFEGEGQVTKMQNQLVNYAVRTQNYYITAPQEGYITKIFKMGIGEIIKEGEPILTLMPAKFDFAVEMYVEPVDIPLIQKGEEVRFMFDGWPALVFSGWPNLSTGTFKGEVYAIDNFISDNGKYRVIITPDHNFKKWPELLRLGSGAQCFTLLGDVPLWYEIWRKFNGFPPDFYFMPTPKEDKNGNKK